MRINVLGSRLAQGLGIFLLIVAVFGDLISPNPAEVQNLEKFYCPPTRLHFVDAQGKFHLRPFVYRYELKNLLDVSYEEKTDRAYPLEFFIQGWSYHLLGSIPASRHLVIASSGGAFYPLGTDALGRDVLARVLAGARTSLLVVLIGVLVYGVLGLTIGGLAGMMGGWIDSLLMRISEFVLALPALYLILALRALLPIKLPYWQTFLITVGTISAVTWPPMARGVRGLILQLRSGGYVEAARSLGSSPWKIFMRHMLPALAPFALTQTAVAAPVFVLGEVLLSFLGVGLHDAAESWGSMLQNVRDIRVLTDFWWNLAPLVFVFATLLCFNLLTDKRRDKEFARIAIQ